MDFVFCFVFCFCFFSSLLKRALFRIFEKEDKKSSTILGYWIYKINEALQKKKRKKKGFERSQMWPIWVAVISRRCHDDHKKEMYKNVKCTCGAGRACNYCFSLFKFLFAVLVLADVFVTK